MFHLFFRPALAWLALSIGVPSLCAANLYFTSVQGLVAYDTAFRGEFNYNQAYTAFSSPNIPNFSPVLTQTWTASTDLLTGKIRLVAAASNNGSNPALSSGLTTVITALGDTLFYTGGTASSGPVNANIQLSGNWFSSATGGAGVNNHSYLRVYFLNPGSFDTPSILAPANIVSQAIWGLGPNFTPNPSANVPVPYGATIGTFPGTVSMPVNLSSLNSGFQVVVLLQVIIDGDTNVTGTFAWNADLGNTLNVNLSAPDGVQLTSQGGLPVASQVPEPASIALAAAGLAIFAIRTLTGKDVVSAPVERLRCHGIGPRDSH